MSISSLYGHTYQMMGKSKSGFGYILYMDKVMTSPVPPLTNPHLAG